MQQISVAHLLRAGAREIAANETKSPPCGSDILGTGGRQKTGKIKIIPDGENGAEEERGVYGRARACLNRIVVK